MFTLFYFRLFWYGLASASKTIGKYRRYPNIYIYFILFFSFFVLRIFCFCYFLLNVSIGATKRIIKDEGRKRKQIEKKNVWFSLSLIDDFDSNNMNFFSLVHFSYFTQLLSCFSFVFIQFMLLRVFIFFFLLWLVSIVSVPSNFCFCYIYFYFLEE